MADPKTPEPRAHGKIAPEPTPPPKQYVVIEEFVDANGNRWLPRQIITLPTDEETAKRLADGGIDEWVPPPPLQGHAKSEGPGVAPQVPKAPTHKG